ncbi:NAD(P)-binding protein [Byssothecium circinans]|uniref:NAD(P)-binding protein n=1 Tax=Byssothecium circinans TaxID=147558 RepID=A0A6A5U0I5_9PLEO|nr:NAD(P)-binding protein [Byssothecium circinans]
MCVLLLICSSCSTSDWKAETCSLRDRARIKEVVEDVGKVFGGQLDVLINSALINNALINNAFATLHTWSQGRSMDDENSDIIEEWDTKIAVGLTAPFPSLAYALLGLMQSMAVSLDHRRKIRVNAVIPGWIHGVKWEEERTEGDAEWHPAGRVGKVEDIAKAVEYAIGCGFMTGQEIVVDGGVGRKMVYPE